MLCYQEILNEEESPFFYSAYSSIVEFSNTRYLLIVEAQIINRVWKGQIYLCRIRAFGPDGLEGNGHSLSY